MPLPDDPAQLDVLTWAQFRSRAQQAARRIEADAGWIRAIDEALVVHHVGCVEETDDYEAARRKINSLLCHAQSIGEYFATRTAPNLACKSVQARLAEQWGYVRKTDE